LVRTSVTLWSWTLLRF